MGSRIEREVATRKIIHIDADCFFAAIEMRDDPGLRGRPMAVGGDADRRGVISTCNYEARRFGVHSAMATAHAKRLCPGLIVVPHRMEAYRDASRVMREIFQDYSDQVEPLSLDEAYLDVSGSSRCQGSATRIAEEIRQRVQQRLAITVSAGVAPNKFVAKVASDWNKPNGLMVVTPDHLDTFVSQLPVGKIPGVGRVLSQKLQAQGVQTCADLRRFSRIELTEWLGSMGMRLFELCRGDDDRAVVTSRRRKSMSVEHTFREDLPHAHSCQQQLPDLLGELRARLAGLDEGYRVIKAFVKVKFRDFTVTTLERVGATPSLADFEELMLEAIARQAQPVRLLGLGVRFQEPACNSVTQLDLFAGSGSPALFSEAVMARPRSERHSIHA